LNRAPADQQIHRPAWEIHRRSFEPELEMISLQDLRFALRSLAKVPGFTFAVIATLALGIGANTAIYSVVRGALLRPLPNRDGERLVYLRQSAKLVGQNNVLFSVPEITDYRTGATVLRGFAEYSEIQATLLGKNEPVRVTAGVITGNYFDVMGLARSRATLRGRDDGPEPRGVCSRRPTGSTLRR
jgi:hypothetical protein